MNLGIFKRHKRFRFLVKTLFEFRSLVVFLLGPYGQTVFFSPLVGGGLASGKIPFEPQTFNGHTKTTFQKVFTAVKGLFSPFHKRVSIFGTGYKSYAPKIFKRRAFVFRVGFGGAEIGSFFSVFVKGRARKQRLVLSSPFHETLSDDFSTLLGLKRPDPYKAKGIRNPIIIYSLKPGKVRANR